MKKMTPPLRHGHDRWLLSYADLVTLLLALFTTLYAASSLDAKKLDPIALSMREAFNTPPGTATAGGSLVTVVPPVTVVAGEPLELRLARDLADAVRLDRIEIRRDGRGLVLSLPEKAAFATGSPELSGEARAMIRRIADAAAPVGNAIRIEGHTDNVPIRGPRFASNLELSTARASAVVAFLVESGAIDASRLSAAGYGEFHPRVANDTPENRAKNRRIDIVVLEAIAR
jgi:chemotaxis protein MotB